jgi:bacteriochlorophyllide a dehydrogenase
MRTRAVVFDRPESLAVRELAVTPPTDADVVVDVEWTAISVGTERLLWTGRMPHFPGMGYPLVPGYETVGRVAHAGTASGRHEGQRVFVPGARCFGDTRGLFGGAAAHLVVPGARTIPVAETLADRGVLLALAATAHHAVVTAPTDGATLVVGHGALGRLLARLLMRLTRVPPTVWETNPIRQGGATGYRVCDPADDPETRYRTIYDVSGDGRLLDTLIGRLAPGGRVVLAGFYEAPLSFQFPPAFLREATISVAAEWQPSDMEAVVGMATGGTLSLDGLITHRSVPDHAAAAYTTAFSDPTCVKMVLDWRQPA